MLKVPHHHLTHHFWETETISPKLPFLHREEMNRHRDPSGSYHSAKQHFRKPPDSIQRKDDMLLQEQNEYVPSWRTRCVTDKVFPLKPVLHKRAYSLSQCQINGHIPDSERHERFYSCLPRMTNQTSVQQQQRSVMKPDDLKPVHQQLTERRKTTQSDLDCEHQKQSLSEKLSKEIHSKELLLQQKIFKAEETLRRIQREKTDREKWNNGLYNDGYDDCGDVRDTYEKEKRNISDDMERWEALERKVKERVKEGRRRSLAPEMTHRREWSEVKNTTEERRGIMLKETQRNSERKNRMGWDNQKEWEDVEEVNKVWMGKYDRRRREMHDREDQEQWRKPGSSDPQRVNRSHLKQDRFTNVLLSEKRNQEGPYEPTTGLSGRRRSAAVESERGNRLLQVELNLEESPDLSHQLVACGVCHRCFLRDRLEMHISVCEKKRPPRKIFDMSKHRAKGTELEEFMKTNSRSKTPELKKNNWRQKHEAFVQSMRQGRAHVPGSHKPQSLSNLNSEYISCPHCSRRFAPGPAERHIPKCQNIRSRPPPPKQQQPITASRKTR